MRILVVYKSKTGFTKEYAQQIAGRLGYAALPHESMTEKDIENADLIIWAAGSMPALWMASRR